MPKQEHAVVAFINGRYVRKGQEEQDNTRTEILAVHQFEGPVAKVRRGYGLTLNQGNYESARVDITLEIPCRIEDVDNADEFARQWVERRIEEEVRSVRGAQKKAGGSGHNPF